MSAPDRRRSPRFPAELDVEYGVGQELTSGKIINIGVAGFGIVGENTYPAGSLIELRLHPPAMDDDLKIKAVVCFSNPARMGVQVISVPTEQANVLETLYELTSRSNVR